VRGVVRDLRSPRPVSDLELGPLDQVSDEGPGAQAAATPGCAVAFLAWGSWREPASVGRVGRERRRLGPESGRARGPHMATPPSPTRPSRCGMEQLRVPKLLAGALAAVSGAVVASLFGVEGTLIGAALVSLLVAPAEAVYTHSLASAHRVARRSLVRRVGEQAGASEEAASEEAASEAHPQPIRWQRVAVAAVLAFGIAVAAITGVETVANQPLASLFGSRARPGASTSVGLVVTGADRSAPPATRAPATSTTSTSEPAPTTTAPVAVPTTTAPVPTVPSTTTATTATPGTHAPTTQRR
jgi:hypothetical protein